MKEASDADFKEATSSRKICFDKESSLPVRMDEFSMCLGGCQEERH